MQSTLHDVTPQIAAPFLLSSRAPVGRRPSIFWRLPFRLVPFVTWNIESHSNLKTLGVRYDETHRANPRLRIPGWARFTPGVSSREKTISLIENLTPWVFLSSFCSTASDEGFRPKNDFWKWEKIQGLLGFRRRAFRTRIRATKTLFYF
jgi:hypothetical protein